jgi:anti-sigma regulatory factor (Ser/Thr protein kinase)
MALQRRALDAAMRLDDGFRSSILSRCAIPGNSVSASQVFDGTRDQVRAVRQFIRAGLSGHPALTDAVLVASELATNAIEHSASGLEGGMFIVHLAEVSADHVAIIVTDQGGPAIPHARDADAGAESGRGLGVVRSLTSVFVTVGGSNMRSVLAVIPAGHARGDGR